MLSINPTYDGGIDEDLNLGLLDFKSSTLLAKHKAMFTGGGLPYKKDGGGGRGTHRKF